MKAGERKQIYEEAELDYIQGKTYKEIAEKFGVKFNTVKSWKRRYKWTRDCTQKTGCIETSIHNLGNNFLEVKEDLLTQLKNNGTLGKHFEDLVDTYMELYKIKNKLIKDIEDRGVAIEWFNGKQVGIKKNDSITELNKTIAQMLSLLNDLGLKPTPGTGYGGGEDEDDL